MIRRPPRSTLSSSSAASDVYKRQVEDRGLGRLDPDDLDARLARLQHLPDTGDGPAGADTGHQDVHSTVGVVPDLLGRGAAVDLRVGLVFELPGQDRTRSLLRDLLRLVHTALHAHRTRGQDQLCLLYTSPSPRDGLL